MAFKPPVRVRDLTALETQTLAMAADGLWNKQIADKLGRSVDGIDTVMRRVLAKLEVRNRAHAVAVAIRRGII